MPCWSLDGGVGLVIDSYDQLGFTIETEYRFK